jgi:hypothetical protein
MYGPNNLWFISPRLQRLKLPDWRMSVADGEVDHTGGRLGAQQDPANAPSDSRADSVSTSTAGNGARRFRVVSEILNFLLVIFFLPVVLTVLQKGVSDSSGLSNISSSVSNAPMRTTGPDFKVAVVEEYLDRSATRPVPFLKIQSLNDDPVTITSVIMNENDDCSDKNINQKLNLGDVYKTPPATKVFMLLLAGKMCEPVKVRIRTDRGEVVYTFR